LRVNSAPPALHELAVAMPLCQASYRLLSIPAYLVEQAPRLLREVEASGTL
jgi:hypothetical protein